MSKPRTYRFVGGPLDGRTFTTSASVVQVAQDETHEYVRTRPTDTNWRETYNRNWWEMGLPEPVPPDYVMEWHERGWLSPEVRMIRDAVTEASDRIFG